MGNARRVVTTKEHRKAFGHVVRAERWRLRISQQELSVKAGFYRDYVHQVENGLVNTSMDSLYLLAKALNVPLSRLVLNAELLYETNR